MASREVMAGSLLEMGFSEIEIDCALQATEYKVSIFWIHFLDPVPYIANHLLHQGMETAVEWLLEQSGKVKPDVDGAFSLSRLAELLPGLEEREEGTGSKRTAIDDAEREDGSQYESGEEEEESGEDDIADDYDDDEVEKVLRGRCSEARVEVGAR